MLITAFFTNRGTPALLLTPTVTITEADGTPVISGAVMTETGGGWYRYDFAGYDASKDYQITGDGGATLEDGDRYVYGTNQSAVDVTRAAVAALNDLSAADVRGQVDAGLATYDPPTKAEVDAAVAPLALQSTVAGLNNLSSAQAQAAAAAALNAYDGPTKAELDTAVAPLALETSIGALNDLAAAEVREQVDAALDAYGRPSGAGARKWVYTLTEQGTGTPISDADVWITTDEAGSNVVASGRTDQAGKVTFWLDAGQVYVWRQKSGWNFVNPDTGTVS